MIYLDCAATSLQKPPAVVRAAAEAMRNLSSPGRGGHTYAMRAAETAFACREEAAQLFGVPEPERVIFTMNATHALNLALHSMVRPGDRVVISGYEHNSVTRPLRALDARVTAIQTPLFDADSFLAEFERALPGAAAAVCTQVSNVFGFVLPIEGVAALCRRAGVPLLVDASQSAGVLPVNLQEWGAAFVAMPGHKGLLGPQGTGLLLCGSETQPLLFGGTGSASAQTEMPEFLPDRLEAGTHNMPGIAGLLAGLRFLRRQGTKKIAEKEARLAAFFAQSAAEIPGLELFYVGGKRQTGVVSLRVPGTDAAVLAQRLGERGVAVRAGLHCAPLAHQSAGTFPDGTVRFSFSPFLTAQEVAAAAKILRQAV